jgi:5-methylcytosine-specific restriction endonuclease McrA
VKCKNCQNEHNGNYGTGSFCSSYCAHSFSTKKNRDEISKKVSKTLKGKFVHNKETFKEIYKKSVETKKILFNQKITESNWEILSNACKRKLVLSEQNYKCSICGIDTWNNLPLKLHLNHIDGDRDNETRENLRFLCPNCHSQTETYCSKNQSKNISDELIEKELINNNFNIVQTIKSLKISYGKNFYKCKKVLDKLLHAGG